MSPVLGGAMGCMPPDKSAWLRHIKAPTVEKSRAHAGALINDLRRKDLDADRYVPAEQIAAYAIVELQNGNEWDAAVLLAMASYRYQQQARLVWELGGKQLYMINRESLDEFAELIKAEAKFFYEQNYDDELDLLRDHLFGVTAVSQRRSQYIEELARGGDEDENIDKHISDFKASVSNRRERLAHPELAKAFLARLVSDHRNHSTNGVAFHHMAATPLDSFRLAALDQTREPFSGPLLRNLVPRMQTLRTEVRSRLHAESQATRANAAAALGLAPHPDDIPMLKERLALETHAEVVDSIRFALAHHGQEEHIKALLERVRKGNKEKRQQALLLLQWLPGKVKAAFNETLFVKLVQKIDVNSFSRTIGLWILKDIAFQRAVDHTSVTAVLALTGDYNKWISAAASSAVEHFTQLSAAECKTYYASYPSARVALLGRMSAIASPGDLQFLSKAYARTSNSRVRAAAARAVANIPGTASLQLLTQWLAKAELDEVPALITRIAARQDANLAELRSMELSPEVHLLVLLASDSKDLRRWANAALHGGMHIKDAMWFAVLSGVFDRSSVTPVLWRLASYRDDEYYPSDAVVRRAALASLVRIALSYRAQRQAQASR